jgi:hypothetical protein
MAAGDRTRMIFELPTEVQMAIRLRAVKSDVTTGEVVCEAVKNTFRQDLEDARTALTQNETAKPKQRK